MTEAEFEKLVRKDNTKALVKALAPLTEAQRSALSKKALQLNRAMEGSASHAVHGICQWSDVRRFVRGWMSYMDVDDLAQILIDRRPEWLPQWLDAYLGGDNQLEWPMIRSLVQSGLCPTPTHPNYIRAMVDGHVGSFRSKSKLVDRLRADPGLLKHEVWRMFEVDMGSPYITKSAARGGEDTWWWGYALRDLAKTGELDRDRLISAVLSALAMPGQKLFKFFIEVLAELEPTLEERAARVDAFKLLLTAESPVTAAFAIDELQLLMAEKKIAGAPLLDAIAPVFALKPKGPSIKAIRLMKTIVKADPSARRAAALAAVPALSHPVADVQVAGIELIALLVKGADAELARVLASVVDTVSPACRKLLVPVMTELGATVMLAEEEPEIEAPAVDVAPLLAEAGAIPEPWRKLAGIDACIAAVNSGAMPPTLVVNPAMPLLDDAKKITPIATLDELLDALARAIETLDDADEFERILDGMSRFAGARPAGFAARAEPLIVRADRLASKSSGWLNPMTKHVHAWLTCEVVPGGIWNDDMQSGPRDLSKPVSLNIGSRDGCLLQVTPADFTTMRVHMLTARAAAGIAGPLLAAPTHRGGWIDPRQVVERMAHWQSRSNLPREHQPDHFDKVQALLRLAPDHRVAALASARSLTGEFADALRFALGAKGKFKVGANVGLWIAAARTRDPNGDFIAFFAGHDADGPDAAVPSVWITNPKPKRMFLTLIASPPLRFPRLDAPTAVITQNDGGFAWASRSTLDVRTRLQIWPVKLDGGWMYGVSAMICRRGDGPSIFAPLAPFLEPLIDAETPLNDAARCVLATGLFSKDPAARGTAVDALIAMIEDGRFTGDGLGAAIQRVTTVENLVHLNRLVPSFTDLARVSPLHHRVAARTFADIVASLDPTPADVHHLLTPLLNWLTESGDSLPEAARSALEKIDGSGKAAKLAQKLLRHEPRPADFIRRANYHALQARVDRACRWIERASRS